MAADLRPHDEELRSVAWCTPEQWAERLAPHKARRINACVHAADTGTTGYLQHGWPPPTPT
ncbi:hypothetical protein [Allostreptomyces psammosilenae]|uniref:Nudix hydrolase domain-containing protein n=1 Tax=Allostreptomyces psammosilenae TaxID=1892865 RepID=A0A852ZSS3_9ACTN|nr:hypothetical protein [Allostreptomyces psammosilenae]NYI04557.1 hypothetical protein [Allostreptomyces psammosilenae]